MQTMVPLYGFGGVPYSAVRKAAPRNLLDNSDFRNPVNQRGNAAQSTNGYWIDRWRHDSVAYAEIKEGCIGINAAGDSIGGVTQVIADASLYNGKKLTLAVCAKSNGGFLRLAFPYVGEIQNVQLSDDWVVYTYTVTFSTNVVNTIGIFAEAGSAIDVKWAALYEGEYTAATCPEYRSKGYGAELAECQRYYCKMQSAEDPVWLSCGHSSYASGPVRFPVQMRIKPTITVIAFRDVTSTDRPYTTVNYTKDGIGYVTNNANNFSTDMTYYILFEASADL